MKKGQITIFIVLGILILAVAAAFFFLSSSNTEVIEDSLPLTTQYKDPRRTYVESCLKDTAGPAIYLLGRQGGRLYPKNYLLTEEEVIMYAYDGKKRRDLGDSEEDLDKYIEEQLDICLAGFSIFTEQGVTVETGSVSSKTKINEDNVDLNVKYPLQVSSGGDSFEVEDFTSSINIRLGQIFDVEDGIIELHQNDPFVYNLEKYTQLGMTIVAFPFDETTTIFSIYDDSSRFQSVPYYYWFALKDEETNFPPTLDYVHDFVLTKGVEFSYTVDASDPENDKLIFSSNYNQFPISDDGKLSFTPSATGTFIVTIEVEDVYGGKDEQDVKFVVERANE